MLHDGMPDGGSRSVDELIGTVGLMIVGGIQEPAHAAANALLGLLGRSEQAARVAADPQRWSAAVVEEGLRWLPPFGMTEKTTTAETILGGLTFEAGTEGPWVACARATSVVTPAARLSRKNGSFSVTTNLNDAQGQRPPTPLSRRRG